MGLKDVTTERQENNGTIAMLDLESGATYTFCASGYYRREYITLDYSRPHAGTRLKKNIYQLNPREDAWDGKRTISFPGEYKKMMILALGPIYSYRKSTKKLKLKETGNFAKQRIEEIINYITQ